VSAFHLAQLNIALPMEPLDTPLLADFVAALDPVNAAADASPGFVWRLQTDEGDATGIRAFGDDRIVVNMSTWASLEALRAFAYGNREHLAVLRRRREWFERMKVSQCLWWVPVGHEPTVAEAEARLGLLRTHGPTPDAFTFQNVFPPPGAADPTPVLDSRDLCPA
jgi:hypothetical protein